VNTIKIFLSQGFTGTKEHLVFPIGLASIASRIDKHDLMCWDPNISPQNYLQKFVQKVDKFKPDVVGLSLRNIDNPMAANSSFYPYVVSMIRELKKAHPSCKLVVGGAGFSIFAEEFMRLNPQIDFGVFSEGEQTFAELLDNLQHPDKVKGLFVRKGKNIHFTGKRDFVDFGSLLPLPRGLFDMSMYATKAAMGIQTKRGCKFNCIYCVHKYYMGSKYRIRNPKKVVDDIEAFVNNYNIRDFYFTDSVFNFPSVHGRQICREIIQRKLDISWEASFRPDYLNEKYMADALKAGCRLFDFSPDGASNNALNVLGKGYEVAQIKKTIDWVSQLEGAKVSYEFMSNVPCYNYEHLRGLMLLVPKILSQCRGKLRYLSLSKMRIYPHTSLYDIALREKKISEQMSLLKPVYYETQSFRNIGKVVKTMIRVSCMPTSLLIKCQEMLENKKFNFRS
jgi:anaerobic magnesium-protoporphyrin IX monomethyl ester cyclase